MLGDLEKLPEVLWRADYLAITLPLTPETQGLIGPAQLGLMKSTAILVNVSRACQVCHPYSEGEIQERVAAIQERTHALVNRSAAAYIAMLDAVAAAKKSGATETQLAPALALQRKAQWRLDFVAAENSMGFHAPQETARVLAESIDYARQGQLAARALVTAH